MSNRPTVARRFIYGMVVAGLSCAGCQHTPTQSQNERPSDSQLAVVPKDAQANDPSREPVDPAKLGTAEALALKVSNYAQQIAPLIEKRQKPSEKAAGEPSAVEWIKPGSPTTLPVRQDAPPQVALQGQPVIDAQPSSANQQLAINAGAATGTPLGAQSAMRVSPDDMNRTVTAPKPTLPAADLEARFSRHIQEYPRDLWAHLDFQMLHFLRDEQVPQLDALTSLPLEDRELVAAVMDGLTNFRNGLRADNNMLLSKKVRPILELADRLRSQADLSIPTLALCTKVDGFGAYEPMEPARFVAGKEHLAIIYCEIENFASSPSGEKKSWETRLSQEAVLYTESGMQVWVDKAGKVVDRSRNRRHDFFIVKKISLPPTLTIGRYLLKVTVEDQQAKRVAEQTMAVEIVAQMETASGK